MVTRRTGVDEAFFQAGYKDVEIIYPFCYKTKNNKDYFRYLEDGRFENITFDKNFCGITFGTYSNSISGLLNNNEFYFKVLSNLNEIITQEEFEYARELQSVYYNQYLEGKKFVAWEVEKLMKLKEVGNKQIIKSFEKNKQEFENDIIVGNLNEPPPF